MEGVVLVELNNENYFSSEMSMKYMSKSQLMSFRECEARTMAEIKGEYVREMSNAFLIGSYVDIALTGTDKEMEKFLADNPQMISSRGETKGQLKAEYQHANKMISKIKNDELMMKTLSGEHQVIMTGDLFGVPFKVKLDSLLEGAIVDLKTTSDMYATFYDEKEQRRVSWIEKYGYIEQGAIYQEIARQNLGKTLPFFLTVVDKTKEPDIAVLQIDNETLAEKLANLEEEINGYALIKQGEIEPIACGKCDYCKAKKKAKVINWLDVGGTNEVS